MATPSFVSGGREPTQSSSAGPPVCIDGSLADTRSPEPLVRQRPDPQRACCPARL